MAQNAQDRIDIDKAAQIRRMLATENQEAVSHRFGEAVLNSPEFEKAQEDLEKSRREHARRREQAVDEMREQQEQEARQQAEREARRELDRQAQHQHADEVQGQQSQLADTTVHDQHDQQEQIEQEAVHEQDIEQQEQEREATDDFSREARAAEERSRQQGR